MGTFASRVGARKASVRIAHWQVYEISNLPTVPLGELAAPPQVGAT